jgi:predicted ferric reductase
MHKYRVANLNTKGNIIELFLEPLGKKVNFIPGQYFFLSFINNKKISKELHPFAISVAPSEETRISAKMLGDYTNELKNAISGDIVKIIGPFGKFSINRYKNEDIVVWIAGGIGITPFLSMLREFNINPPTQKKFYFFYCVKNPEEAIYTEEINLYKLNNMVIINHYSDLSGFISTELIEKKLGEDFSKAIFMICGPTPMMKSLNKGLKNMNVNSKRIIFENYSFK